MRNKIGGKRKQAEDVSAGSGASTAAVAEVKTETVDGHVMGEKVSDAELTAAELSGGYAAGSLVTARNEGKIAAVWSRVEISDKKTGRGGKRAYVRLEAVNAQGMPVLCKGQINPAPAREEGKPKPQTGVCDCFNYGFDLDQRTPHRAALAATLEGPEKAIKKMVQGLIAGEMEADEIRAMVKRTPKFANVAGIDKLIDLAFAK